MSSAFDDVVNTSSEPTDELSPEYDLSHGSVINGDTLSVLPELPQNEFHAIVCDPPYNYDGGFMQQEWDDIGSGTDYQQWCREWAEKALKTLKPGGHLIAFSGNTSHHRLMSGIEDAGYEIRDTITWHYGDGFSAGSYQKVDQYLEGETAEKFEDFRYGLKPATEFAVLARSPQEGSITSTVREHGTGVLNVPQCRISYQSEATKPTEQGIHDVKNGDVEEGDRLMVTSSGRQTEYLDEQWEPDDDGRYPSNLLLDPVMADVMDAQGPTTDSGTKVTNNEIDGTSGEGGSHQGVHEGYERENSSSYTDDDPDSVRQYGDGGGVSRFFYCTKPSKSEKTHDGEIDNNHSTVKPRDLMGYLVRLVTAEGQKVLDPFAGSGTTLLAADDYNREAVGIEMSEEYVEITEQRFEAASEQ